MGALQGTEGLLLQQLIEEKHHIVRAAWEVYEVDPNVEELMDTLVHVVKLEKVRRGYTSGGAQGHETVSQLSAQAQAQAQEKAREAEVAARAQESASATAQGMPAEFVRLLQAGCEASVLATSQRDFFLQKFASLDPLVIAAWQIYELEQVN